MHNCDEEEARWVGPVKDEDHGVFYFTFADELKTKRYEFHKKKTHEHPSFIYWLKELRHISLHSIIDYLEQDLETPEGSLGLMASAADSLRDIGSNEYSESSELANPYDHIEFGSGLEKLVRKTLKDEGKQEQASGMHLDSFRV